MLQTVEIDREIILSGGYDKKTTLKICCNDSFSILEKIQLYHQCSTNGFVDELIEVLDEGEDEFNNQIIALAKDHPSPEKWILIASKLVLYNRSDDELTRLKKLASSSAVDRAIDAWIKNSAT